MGQKPRELSPYRSALDFFGAELRRVRVARGMSLQRLSAMVHYDASLLAKIERAERSASSDLAVACDTVLGSDGALVHLWEFAQRDRAGRLMSDVDALGTIATGSATVSLTGGTIPLMASVSGRMVQLQVDRRTLLQAILSAGAGRAISEAAYLGRVQRPVDPVVIDHFARLRAVLVEADNLLGPQHLLSTVRQQLAVMDDLRRSTNGPLRRSLLAAQSHWAEFAGWLSDDIGDIVTGTVWADRAMEMAQEADDRTWVAYVLARKAQRAGHAAESDRTVGLAQAAQRTPDLPPLVRAFTYLQQAQGHALAGETRDCEAAVNAAQDLVAARTATDGAEPGGFCRMSYLRQQEADCWLALHRPDRAIASLEVALDDWPTAMERDRGLCLVRLACAHLAGEQPEPERAAAAATEAYWVGIATGSERILTQVHDLAIVLTSWRDQAPVDEFLGLVNDRRRDGT